MFALLLALACALRSLTLSDGTRAVNDGTIQALCRWSSTESLKVYARINRTEYAQLVAQAGQVRFDSVQARTLWDSVPPIDDDARYTFAEQLHQHVRTVDQQE